MVTKYEDNGHCSDTTMGIFTFPIQMSLPNLKIHTQMYIEVYIERSQDFQVYVAVDAEQ